MNKDFLCRPLAMRQLNRRVYILPGRGVGLGDQFILLPVLRDLAVQSRSRFELLCSYREFWNSQDWGGSYRDTTDELAVSKVLQLAEPCDLILAGDYGGAEEALAAAPCDAVFCKGGNLASFRAFYQSNGVVREISMQGLANSLTETGKFRALFHDFGFAIDPKANNDIPQDALALGCPNDTSLSGTKLLLHPFSAKAYKTWPLRRWVAVAHELLSLGAEVALSSGATPSEKATAGKIADAVAHIYLEPPVLLAKYLEVMRKYDIVISCDTFVPHAIAAMPSLRPASLALYGPTDPLRFCPASPANYYLSGFDMPTECVAEAVARILSARSVAVTKKIMVP